VYLLLIKPTESAVILCAIFYELQDNSTVVNGAVSDQHQQPASCVTHHHPHPLTCR